MLYRRFGYIHSRLLLHLQDELRELETELHDMDKRDAKNEQGRRCLQSREEDEERGLSGQYHRGELLGKIKEKVSQYGTCVNT